MDNIHAFGQALVNALAERGISTEYLADDEAIRFDRNDGHGVLGVENFYRTHLAGRTAEDIADQLVRLHQQMQGWIASGTPSFNEARPLLRLTLVHENFNADIGTCRPILPGIKAAVVFDYPEFMRHVLARDIAAMGEPEDVLWEVASANTFADMPEPTMVNLGNNQNALVFECSYGAAYAWMYAIGHESAFLAVPRRDLGVVLPGTPDDMQAMAAIASVTYGLFNAPDSDHPLLPTVYYLKNGELAGLAGAVPNPQKAS